LAALVFPVKGYAPCSRGCIWESAAAGIRGVTLDSMLFVAKSGVDFISFGALTHSARALDMSLEVGSA